MEKAGTIKAIYRYPVKSMSGEMLDSASLGWHGIDGDRRLAFARSGIQNGFPWLSAGKLPALIAYVPRRAAGADADSSPAIVTTPDGRDLELRGAELRAEIEAAHGAPLELMELRNGIFDDASVSVICTATIAAICAAAGVETDPRRFRPNFLLETVDGAPFNEDGWVGRTLRLGEADDAPLIAICQRDLRCSMIGIDPTTAASDPRVLKAAVRLNENWAGVYATVTRAGRVAAGDAVYLL